jgi:hypothetical protein
LRERLKSDRLLEELFNLQTKTEQTFTAVNGRFVALESALETRLRSLEDRLTRMEAEQGQVVTEAKSAATGAATVIASAVISDSVTRVTRVEERLNRLEQPASANLPRNIEGPA